MHPHQEFPLPDTRIQDHVLAHDMALAAHEVYLEEVLNPHLGKLSIGKAIQLGQSMESAAQTAQTEYQAQFEASQTTDPEDAPSEELPVTHPVTDEQQRTPPLIRLVPHIPPPAGPTEQDYFEQEARREQALQAFELSISNILHDLQGSELIKETTGTEYPDKTLTQQAYLFDEETGAVNVVTRKIVETKAGYEVSYTEVRELSPDPMAPRQHKKAHFASPQMEGMRKLYVTEYVKIEAEHRSFDDQLNIGRFGMSEGPELPFMMFMRPRADRSDQAVNDWIRRVNRSVPAADAEQLYSTTTQRVGDSWANTRLHVTFAEVQHTGDFEKMLRVNAETLAALKRAKIPQSG